MSEDASENEGGDSEGEESEMEGSDVLYQSPKSGAEEGDYKWEMPKKSEDKASKTQEKAPKKPRQKQEPILFPDCYQMDPFLVRREATLLHLCLKSFQNRVIVFFNTKIQCTRMATLFAMHGLKAVCV